MKEKRFFYLVAIIGFLFFNNLSAQVTIGSMEDPLQGSLLDFKQYNTSGSIENANKGVVFPRVSLENCTSLKPLSTANDAGEMQKYTGMVVYNLVEDNTLGLDFGLMSWNGEEWIPIFNKSGMGVFTVTADPIVTGTLVKNRTFTTTSNSIELPVNVTKTGTYSIVLRSNNGYYFSASGEFYAKGAFTIVLSGSGTPAKSTSEQGGVEDALTLLSNGMVMTTPGITIPTLYVADIAPEYYYTINNVDISETNLKVGRATNESVINVRISVPNNSAGALFNIQTDEVDGVSYSASGTLEAGQHTITLNSNGGTPSKYETHVFRLTSNSSDPRVTPLNVSVPIEGRNVKIVVFGNTGGWEIIGSKRTLTMMTASTKLFGLGQNLYDSLCPVEGFTLVDAGNTVSESYLTSDVDLVIINYLLSSITDGAYTRLKQMATQDKVPMIWCADGTYANNNKRFTFLTEIFGSSFARSENQGWEESVSTLIGGNDLVSGAYALIGGKQCGPDGRENLYFSNVPSNATVIARRTADQQPTIIKHNIYPFVVVGDGGFFNGGDATFADANNEFRPVKIDTSTGLPIAKTQGRYSFGSYNGHLLANTLIWAIQYRLNLKP